MGYPLVRGFPVNSDGFVVTVAASVAVAPIIYANGFNYDATGAVVVTG